MAKDRFLQIRLESGDYERIAKAAAAEHLEVSTWARRVLLMWLDGERPTSGGSAEHRGD